MDENENSYRKIIMEPERRRPGFGRSVFVPFTSGILGASLVVGTCFGVPSVREKLLGSVNTNDAVSASSMTTTAPVTNTNLVSLSSYSDTAVGVAEKVQPSIVGITVEYNVNSMFSRQTSTANASGSGVIISEDGYILTNNHIVNSASTSTFYQLSEATKVTVNLYGDDTEYEATIVGMDSETDLAVIKIDKTGLPAATLGNSDSLKVGEFAMAVGNPLGMSNSITCGVISALNREVTDDDGKKYTLIQTDAAINSGNSGGALVNSKGEVIGINSMKLSGTGIEGMGFSIPINGTKDIASQLIQYKKVKRPYIGISGIDITEDLSKKYNYPIGVYVRSVDDFTAAQKAGIKAGDVITQVEDTEIKSMDELNKIKNTHKIGDTISLKVYRDKQYVDVSVELAEQP